MIYFIRAGDDGPVKIGVSENATQRVADLRTANPAKLSVIRLIEGGRLQERALHMEFRNLYCEVLPALRFELDLAAWRTAFERRVAFLTRHGMAIAPLAV